MSHDANREEASIKELSAHSSWIPRVLQNSKFKIQSPNVWVSMRFIIINEFWFTWFKFKDRKLACVCGTCQHLLEKRIIYLFLPCASYNFDFLFIIFYLNMVDISEDPPPLLVRARKISFIFFFISVIFSGNHLANPLNLYRLMTFIVKLRLIINNIHYLLLSSNTKFLLRSPKMYGGILKLFFFS
jgi:hypothetical protein